MLNDRSDLSHCLDIISIKLIDKIDYSDPIEVLSVQLQEAEKDCKILQKDINDVAKILFEKKTIQGTEIDELTAKYYTKYSINNN